MSEAPEITALYDAASAATGDENREGEYLHHASPYVVVEIIDRLRVVEAALTKAREAIHSCDIGAFGWGDLPGDDGPYPLKDELLRHIDAALEEAK